MADVQSIGKTHPEAQQVLIEELHRSNPNMWPLVVQQFSATLALHEELKSKPAYAPEEPSDINAQMSASPALPMESRLGTVEPPSEALGKLPDPRTTGPDPEVERLFAAATPANMPAPNDAAVNAFAAAAPRTVSEDSSATPIQSRLAHAEQQVDPASTVAARASTESVVKAAVYQVDTPHTAAANASHEDSRFVTSQDWQQHLSLSIDDLESRAGATPSSTAEVHQAVSLRLMKLLAGRTEESLEPIPGIAPLEQDYWSAQVFALATFLDHHAQPDDKRRAAASVIQLDNAVSHLREIGSLSLRNLAFCEKVYGYGAYEAIDEPKFAAGDQVSLYVEVENYHSQSTEKGFTTMLGASYRIVDAEGKRVDGGEFPIIEDCCRTRRRDFHIQYGLAIPKSLTAGKYRLELAMKDRQSDKLGHATIDFAIGRP
jgi:hypothetical protein